MLRTPVILFFSSEVVSRLSSRLEVQFALCNLAGRVIGILAIFHDKVIAVCYVFVYSVAVLRAIFLDAAMERGIKSVYLLYHFMSMSILMGLRINIAKVNSSSSEMRITGNAADDAEFSMIDFIMRCISNILILCVTRFIILARYPHFLVSLKCLLKTAKTSAELHELVVNSKLSKTQTVIVIRTEGNYKDASVNVVISVRKSFEYQIRDTIGRLILGPEFSDRYLKYKYIQRIYTGYYVVSLIPCNWYMISMLTNSNGQRIPLSSMDIIIGFLAVLPTIASLLFVNPNLLLLSCRSLDIYMVLVPCVVLYTTCFYMVYGTNMVIFPMVFAILSLTFALQDVHIHRRTFSLITSIYFIYLVSEIYICLVWDLFPFNLVAISLLGFRSISIKSICVGWTMTLLIILVRNLYQLIREPECFLFIKTPFRVLKTSEDACRAMKAMQVTW